MGRPYFGGLRCQLRQQVFVQDHLAAAVQRGLLGQVQKRAVPGQQWRRGLCHQRAPVTSGVTEPGVGVHDQPDGDHRAGPVPLQESGVVSLPGGVAEPMRRQPDQRRRGGLGLAGDGLGQHHRAANS
jgi:hypothetical protein